MVADRWKVENDSVHLTDDRPLPGALRKWLADLSLKAPFCRLGGGYPRGGFAVEIEEVHGMAWLREIRAVLKKLAHDSEILVLDSGLE